MTYALFFSSKKLQNALEIAALLATVLAFIAPGRALWLFAALERVYRPVLACRRWLLILCVAAVPMVGRALLLPVFPIPSPYVHDEFSYLLLGDTLAHFRLANPTPPGWHHFETEYVLLQPTYASQYQPGQGLVLAAGELATGQPWWGVWVSIGLMCGSICWALSYFVPRRWAAFGALAAAFQFGIYGFWMNSYFGGAVAATGGALVFGSLLKLRRAAVSSSIVCGLGLVVLLASRPFEAILWILIATVRIATGGGPNVRRSLACTAAVLSLGGGLLCLYNERVTGNPLQPPYMLYREKYGTPQSFWWQPAIVITHFDIPELKANYLNQYQYWRKRYSPAAIWDSTWRRVRDFWRFFIGPFLTLALIPAWLLLRDKKFRPWLYASMLFIADHATYHAWYPQHTAPATILIIAVVVQGWRHVRTWGRNRGVGLALVRYNAAAFVLVLVLAGVARTAEPHLPARWAGARHYWETLYPERHARDRSADFLRSTPGKHLVFVHYRPGHFTGDEWVFNEADIPNAKIVFARELDPASDLALIQAFPNHRVWVADADGGVLREIDAANAR